MHIYSQLSQFVTDLALTHPRDRRRGLHLCLSLFLSFLLSLSLSLWLLPKLRAIMARANGSSSTISVTTKHSNKTPLFYSSSLGYSFASIVDSLSPLILRLLLLPSFFSSCFSSHLSLSLTLYHFFLFNSRHLSSSFSNDPGSKRARA